MGVMALMLSADFSMSIGESLLKRQDTLHINKCTSKAGRALDV